MLKRLISWIPNTITCLNLIAGSLACIMSFSSAETFGSLTGTEWVFILIAAAAVFDFCDGASARLLHAYSAIGKELDSLSDLVSFGLAPSLLVYNTMARYTDGSILSFAALFIVVMGALRLARFNVDDRQTTSFIGLPIPANAITWIGLIAWINAHGYPGSTAMIILIIITGLLMVSGLRMFSLKFKNFAWRENLRRYALIAGAVIFVITDGLPGLAWTILLYILLSVVRRRDSAA